MAGFRHNPLQKPCFRHVLQVKANPRAIPHTKVAVRLAIPKPTLPGFRHLLKLRTLPIKLGAQEMNMAMHIRIVIEPPFLLPLQKHIMLLFL